MKNDDAITHWLEQLQEDSSSAARHLWDAYFQKMVKIAGQRLPRGQRQIADEEDVALSAFKSFCRGVKQGRFQHLIHRDSIWAALVAITLNKARDQERFVNRQKRGGQAKHEPLWEDVLGREPTAEFTLQLSETLEQLLVGLDQAGIAHIRAIVLSSLEGYTPKEVADQLDCAISTVHRKLQIVRRWLIENAGAHHEP